MNGLKSEFVAGATLFLLTLTVAACSAQTFTVLADFNQTTLYSFFGGTDGAQPYNGLVLAASGALYGTTNYGGVSHGGTVFRMTQAGQLTIVYSFTGGTDGTVFDLTPNGKLSTLYSFMGGSDGGYPWAGLVQGTDGAFYGTTSGMMIGPGTAFKVTADTFRVLQQRFRDLFLSEFA